MDNGNGILLPDSRTRHQKLIFRGGSVWVQTYCASCGVPGVQVPAETSYVTYFCIVNGCAERFQADTNAMLIPDELFGRMVAEEQLEKYGRFLEHDELVEVLKDGNSTLSKLARDR